MLLNKLSDLPRALIRTFRWSCLLALSRYGAALTGLHGGSVTMGERLAA